MHRSLALMSLLILCIVAARNSSAADDPPKKLGPRAMELIKGSAEDFIKALDKKKNGYLTKDDLPPGLAKAFEKFDTNNDGKLDKKEVEEMLKVLRKRLLDEASPDKPAEKKDTPAKTDKPAEKKDAPPAKSALSPLDFDRLDKNADGRLTRDEVKGTPYEKLFDEIDTNKDGKIDRREFEAYLKKIAEKK